MVNMNLNYVEMSDNDNLEIQLNNLNVQREYLSSLEDTKNKLIKLQENDMTGFILAGGISLFYDVELKIIDAKEAVKWAEETVKKYQ